MKARINISRSKMPALLAFTFLFALMFTGGALRAQNPVMHQQWTFLEESPKHIDATYCVVECPNEDAKIFLRLFNENPTGQSLDFTLTVTDGTNTPVEYDVTGYKLAKAAMVNPSCGSSDYSDLMFAVPSGFDPGKMKVEISYP
jgi:hypothetical protein